MRDAPDDRPTSSPAVHGSTVRPAGRDAAGGAQLPGANGDAPAHERSDAELLSAYTADDANAFAQLYDRHARATWRFIRHRLGPDNEAAADAVLEASWIDAAMLARVDPGARAWTRWLYTLVRRHALARLPSDGDDATDDASFESTQAVPLTADPKARARALLVDLARLPALVREAVVLHFETGAGAEGIATITGHPVDATRTRLHDGLRRLAQLVVPLNGETDFDAVARGYGDAWALRDASSRGPSIHAHESALAAARSIALSHRREGLGAPQAARGAADAEGAQVDFAAAVDAALASALHDDALREAEPKTVPMPLNVEPEAHGEAPSPRFESSLTADGSDASQAPEPPRARRPPAANRPPLAVRAAGMAFVSLMAGVAGWQVRDKLGPNVIGAVFELPTEPTSYGTPGAAPRSNVDETLARAEALLARTPPSAASASAADASAPLIAAAVAPAVPLPASATAPAPLPETATPAAAVPAMVIPRHEPANVARAASSSWHWGSRIRVAGRRALTASEAAEAAEAARAAEAAAAAQARADAFLGQAEATPERASPADAGASKRPEDGAEGAAEAARARADALPGDVGASSSAR